MPIEESPEQRLRIENADLRAKLAKAHLLSAAVESSDDAILTNDLEDHMTSWNRGAERLFGYTAEEIMGKPLSVLVPPERCHDMSLILERIRSGERVDHFETQYRAKNGRLVDVSMTVSPLYDDIGQMVGASKIIRDVSERKRVETALRESEARWRFALKTTNMGAWELNLTDKTAWRSVRYAQIFGYTDVQPEWTYQSFLQHVLEEDREQVNQQIQDAIAQHHNWTVECRIRRTDGQVRWIWVRGIYLGEPGGSSERVFGLLEDITKRKQAELEQREASQHKDEFLAMLAHELRNPLAPICNALQILRLTEKQSPAMERAAGMIGRQVNQLIRLVDDLLDVSRVSRGKITLQKALLDLAAVVQQAVETSQSLIESREHTLNVMLPEHKIRVNGDFTRLAQVISNLLNNAAKYTDAGGVIALTVESLADEGPAAGAKAVIRVRDNGRGIDPAVLGSLFDLFYQADRNIDRAEGGLGIGLSLVKSLVDMHDGRVEAYSAGRGMGSEFVIYLPCQLEAPAVQAAQAPLGLGKVKGRHRILLVDDNPDVADSMAMLLELYGQEVLVANDGRQGVELALREKPDMILLDIGLPYMDGYQACRAIRAAGLEDILIVALTGYSQDEDRNKAAAAGFDWHLAKPVDMQALEDLLASLPVR